ncbi:TPA: 50S ribosomal protein L10 [Candidatus Woesearchaeota archaeon]|nr:50S ribosomal protein L10 [Candidatus Woesearchaeota archaeon]
MAEKKAHVSENKKKVVQEFTALLKQYPIVAAVNMQNMPAPQLQKMRAILRENVIIRMTKRRLIKIAIDNAKASKPGLEKLEAYLPGMPALLFTKDNPFKLNKILQQNKSKAPAKGGQIAPNDLIVPAGATPFAPGPVIGELAALGIKTGVEGGKIAIKQDAVVVKAGKEISQKAAEILTRLGIEPMEIGLDLIAAYESGIIFTKDVLTVDDAVYLSNLENASRTAFFLAMEIGYATKATMEPLIIKAFRDAKALGLSQTIMADAIIGDLVTKAEREMLSLKNAAKIEVSEKNSSSSAEDQKKN